jgi:tryptophan synthase beta chain
LLEESRLTRKTNEPPRDDPWSPVAKSTIDELRDRRTDLRTPATAAIEVGFAESDAARTGVSTELVDLLTDSIGVSPERADLWMMRFEMYRSLGMKPEFHDAIVDAWTKPRVRRLLDWPTINALWDAVAPGEGLPSGVTPNLSEAPPPGATATGGVPAAPWQGNRRFADVAMQIAGAELNALSQAYGSMRAQAGFYSSFARHVAPILNRPSPLQLSGPLTHAFGGPARVWLKREDKLRHSPELGNAVAQCYLATLLGKSGIISGNDVDMHAVALATIGPRFNLEVTICVRAEDQQKRPEVVARLRALKANIVIAPTSGLITHDPREAALRYWQTAQQLHLALSLGTGPRPYPTMVSDFQSLLGRETALQVRAQAGMSRPWNFVAAVNSEADSIGFMLPHLPIPQIPLYYAEPDRNSRVAHASTRTRAYNGLRREHAWLKASGRIGYGFIPDEQAQAAQDQVKRLEGFAISLEDARAIAEAQRLALSSAKECEIVVLVA